MQLPVVLPFDQVGALKFGVDPAVAAFDALAATVLVAPVPSEHTGGLATSYVRPVQPVAVDGALVKGIVRVRDPALAIVPVSVYDVARGRTEIVTVLCADCALPPLATVYFCS